MYQEMIGTVKWKVIQNVRNKIDDVVQQSCNSYSAFIPMSVIPVWNIHPSYITTSLIACDTFL